MDGQIDNLKEWFADQLTHGELIEFYSKKEGSSESYEKFAKGRLNVGLKLDDNTVNLQFRGFKVVLSSDGTYYLNDTSGG